MKKSVEVNRTLLISIVLTSDAVRDLIALEAYNFEGLMKVMSTQKRDMVGAPHEPQIFYMGPEGVFSHSLSQDFVLSIWKEDIAVVD